MAIFNSSDDTPTGTGANATSIITSGAKIGGELNVTCALFIDGEIEGSIISNGEVTVGKSGRVHGDVTAKNVIVSGEIKGTVDSDRIAINAEGKVEGTLISSELIIEPKGTFVGESKIKEAEASRSVIKKVAESQRID